ncbi:hypothetical protein FB474_0096 [Oryzihumus leptocrescens]|uniref:Uncharacterized protein n=1 Tax=Oryzihumus leptocrescens TaxID=297536 RepID=A0A542ZEP7_9MICO|nr:hypothetical protein FB474_0096 [Oryzihumus leptocrescens]
MTSHHGWLVPVRITPDGGWAPVCFLDDATLTSPDGWSLWCPDCQAIVAAPVQGTAGLDLEGTTTPDAVADEVYRAEARLAREHAAAMATQPSGCPASA